MKRSSSSKRPSWNSSSKRWRWARPTRRAPRPRSSSVPASSHCSPTFPPTRCLAAGAATKLAVFNLGDSADALRQQQCRPNLFHLLPSERMRSDALAQYLVSRRWSKVLLLHGPRPEDAVRLASVQLSLKRFGLNTVATRPFKLSADPRERNLANPLLLTGNTDHDVVWVVDTDGEFARLCPIAPPCPARWWAMPGCWRWPGHRTSSASARRSSRAASRGTPSDR